ncbi:hypothetical protein N3K66_000003 [Trichothecium roseum]|uniref:Uncharacterized protein n=1 Tax=Trichothecium roseum TaxID=47278 RepID=A0ACC0VAR0_9HYPO|nr:hypothetical protein N3K66_000003 [Trichothecium roseum]
MTLATIMTGAWAIALAMNDGTDDVVFTHTSSGRQAPLKGIEAVAGITTARVPVRVSINKVQSISSFLSNIQQQASDSVPHEHYGVANIAKALPEVSSAITQPTSLLALQPANQRNTEDGLGNDALLLPGHNVFSLAEQSDGFHMAPLVTHCFLGEDNIDMHSNFNRRVVSAGEVEALYDRLEKIILHLSHYPHRPVQSAFDC